jgi:hypothetical protein
LIVIVVLLFCVPHIPASTDPDIEDMSLAYSQVIRQRREPWFALATQRQSIRNELGTIEKKDHFCGFQLQIRSEGGRKDHYRPEFNRKTLAGYQIGEDIASTRRLRAIPSPER